jgi:hypothetical protein
MDGELAMRIIAARCEPEVLDYVVSFDVLALIVEVLDAMEDRLQALEEAVQANVPDAA